MDETSETDYLRRLLSQVDRVLENYRALAQDLEAAHDWLRCIAAVLHSRLPAKQNPSEPIMGRFQVLFQAESQGRFCPNYALYR